MKPEQVAPRATDRVDGCDDDPKVALDLDARVEAAMAELFAALSRLDAVLVNSSRKAAPR